MSPQTIESEIKHAPDAPQSADDRAVDWQTAMKLAIRSQQQLCERLGILSRPHAELAESFPTFVPLELLSRIVPGDPHDPILRQVLATPSELVRDPAESVDPVGDLETEVAGGLLKKYDGRALLVSTGACAVHCRYCFRREFPYSESTSTNQRFEPALQAIENDPSIEEVILSGGDPLTLVDSVLGRLIRDLDRIPHVKRLRIHTRLPVVIPQRITTELLEYFTGSSLAVWMVIHTNHAQEMDDAVSGAIRRLVRAGIPVLNQSVLLAGVNDEQSALVELSRRLINLGAQPYYLHQLDRVPGSSHFWVDPDVGKSLVQAMREQLPGYAVPQYVVEQAGEKSKTPIV